MLRNLFIVSLRSIRRDKTYSIVNVLGLTIGITCSIFLLLYILEELSYDRYHANSNNIYRVATYIGQSGNMLPTAASQWPLADELRDNYAGIEHTVRLSNEERRLYSHGDKSFYESLFYIADSTVLDVFTYTIVAGDAGTALDEPFSIVLTRSIAIKYFGTVDVLGETLQDQRGTTFNVTAVIEDVPRNSHLRFEALISARSYPGRWDSWTNFGIYTYVQLKDGYSRTPIDSALVHIVRNKVEPIFSQFKYTIAYKLQHLPAIHLYSKPWDGIDGGGDISYIYIFGSVAALMLVIATINYINLATARSANRSKEVGIRKVMGSGRRQLMVQFIAESVLITLMALAVSIVLICLLLPAFNTLANKHLSLAYLLQARVATGVVFIVLFIGVIGGSYPAFYLSGFNPVRVLKGKLATGGRSAGFRKALVVVQFTISIVMFISTLVVLDQLTFLRNKDLGFNKERVLRLPLTGQEKLAGVLAERMRQTRGVEWAGAADAAPGVGMGRTVCGPENNEGETQFHTFSIYSADFDYFRTMGITMAEGRNFSPDVPADTVDAVLVNETLVKRMSWKQAIGKKILFPGNEEMHVIGVVKDYHQESLYDIIDPLIIRHRVRNGYVFVKTKEGTDIHEALSSIESTWRNVMGNAPFEYFFTDQDFSSQYTADEKRNQIYTVFSGLTLVIACLGLLGLAAYTIEQRYREIGVRKVIGASMRSLVVLVSREFMMLVGISILIAFGLAWYITEQWLQRFAYRIDLSAEWLTFLVSAAVATVITLVTIGYHVFRAASANPVNVLRDE